MASNTLATCLRVNPVESEISLYIWLLLRAFTLLLMVLVAIGVNPFVVGIWPNPSATARQNTAAGCRAQGQDPAKTGFFG
jgi:hypothetical protein